MDDEEIKEVYSEHHDILFTYKGITYFFVCGIGADYIQKGLRDNTRICECEKGKALTDLKINGVTLYDMLKEAININIY